MYIERNIYNKFKQVSQIYNCVALVGARQSGKTTFLKKRLDEVNGFYLSMDDLEVKEIFDKSIKLFENTYLSKDRVIGIDEIQYCKDSGIKLKYLIDKGYKIWITSSTETILNKEVLSYLVGRVSIFRILPFSLDEFFRANSFEIYLDLPETVVHRLLIEHILFGGYPKVVLTKDVSLKEEILRNLIDTLIYKDVMKTFYIEDEESLRKTILYLSEIIGNILNYDNLSNDLNISYQTLKKYLIALEKSYVIKLVKPFYSNKLKEITRSPKIYFIDTGLRNVLSKNKKIDGKLFENYVFTELLKKGYDIKYWRTKSKAEVDFILNDSVPVEVKLKPKVERSLLSFIDKYKPKKAFVVFLEGDPFVKKWNGTEIVGLNVFDFLKSI